MKKNHPYTGLFRTGCRYGLMRISDVVKTTPEVIKTSPGHGVKCMRDGMSSGNWLAMFSFDGQTSFNFFKNRWTSILREFQNECARQTNGKHFAEASDHVGGTSLMEFSKFDEFGNEEKDFHWPFQLVVEPYDVYGWTDEFQNDFTDQLSIIPPNTVMFKIFAFDSPPELGGEELHIGWVVSRSIQTTSGWGDIMLFFQHHRMEDDIKLRPWYFDWLQFWTEGKFSETPLINPPPQVTCPFSFLFDSQL